MPRCTWTENLEVHHIKRNGGNDIENARVLCQKCHEATKTYGLHGNTPPNFDQKTKDQALKDAGYQCECTSNGVCHRKPLGLSKKK